MLEPLLPKDLTEIDGSHVILKKLLTYTLSGYVYQDNGESVINATVWVTKKLLIEKSGAFFFLFFLHNETPPSASRGRRGFQHFMSALWKNSGSALLVGRDHNFQAAHVGLQHLGDGHGAIGLQMVLQEGDQHTRRSHAGVVQGVGQIGLAVLALDADVQAACLCIAQVGAGADL